MVNSYITVDHFGGDVWGNFGYGGNLWNYRVWTRPLTETEIETLPGTLAEENLSSAFYGKWLQDDPITEGAIGYRFGDRMNRVTIPSQVGRSLLRWHYGDRAQSQNHTQRNWQVLVVKTVDTVTQINQQRLAEKTSDKGLNEYHESPQSRFGQMTMDDVASRQRPYKPAQQVESRYRTGRAIVSLSIRQLIRCLQPPAVSQEILKQRLLLGRASRPRPPTGYHQD